ncbi:recombinase family protein [Actinomadura rupiterrae]|uniref:recombinase family protein n=1 Tax=Actinomadura rupiterrae TaxID=559627 RepID=UPI0020A60102|nr:recombinase family protein [Actinomadura rupiterrae]MCP2338918.1 DNA invertase Pin-like site-specific DNA recombinase [Actinomadura rupiterrae]
MRAAVYARISEDDLKLERGVARQLRDGQQLAARLGWKVVLERSDNDVSALKGKPRPGYADVLAAVEHDEVDQIICYHMSRLWRNRKERAEAIEVLQRHHVSVTPVKGPALDMSTAYGRAMAGVLGEFDTLESEVKSERIQRAALDRAQEGRANGVVAYGWRRVYQTGPDGAVLGFRDVEFPEQAAVVREIVDRLLDDESLRSIAKDLTARGVPRPNGADRWRPTTVRKLALRPGNVGLRIYHRGRPDETYYPAAWPAIVEQSKHERVVKMLGGPERRVARTSSQRRHLLTFGVGCCGVCGGILRVQSRRSSKMSLYVCLDGEHVGRSVKYVDAKVEDEAVRLLAMPDLLGLVARAGAETAEAAEQVAVLRARKADAADAFACGEIDREQLCRINDRIDSRLVKAEREAATMLTEPDLADLRAVAGPAAAAVWRGLSVERRHRLLVLLRFKVTILRTARGPGFRPESVSVEHVGTLAKLSDREGLSQPG